jgi:hypothetical protein
MNHGEEKNKEHKFYRSKKFKLGETNISTKEKKINIYLVTKGMTNFERKIKIKNVQN